MLKSMTGFGRSEQQNGDFACTVEIRSVNNRYIEINTRLPKYLTSLELAIKKLIKSRCSRGSFDLNVTLQSNEGGTDQAIKPNLNLAAQYYEAFQEIKKKLNLEGEIKIDAVFGLKDILKVEPLTLDDSQVAMILDTVDQALGSLNQMRREEGKNLQDDILGRLESVAQQTRSLQERQPVVIQEHQNRLLEKVKTLSNGIELDPARLAQEVALMADRCDISEEITRLESHLGQFNVLTQSDDPLGRKLEFLIQEINREINTIGSKSADYQISQAVIEIKSLLEKVREQIQNIE